MTFLVAVRWHPDVDKEAVSANWIVNYVAGDCYHLILCCADGVELRIPLALVESMHLEQRR